MSTAFGFKFNLTYKSWNNQLTDSVKNPVHFQFGSVHLNVPVLLEKTKIFVLFVSTDILYTISIILWVRKVKTNPGSTIGILINANIWKHCFPGLFELWNLLWNLCEHQHVHPLKVCAFMQVSKCIFQCCEHHIKVVLHQSSHPL